MRKETVTTKKIMGRYTVLRKRISKRRPFEYCKGECFHALHLGKWSLYVSLPKPKKPLNVSITDKR